MALADFDQPQIPAYAYTANVPVAGVNAPAPVLTSARQPAGPVFRYGTTTSTGNAPGVVNLAQLWQRPGGAGLPGLPALNPGTPAMAAMTRSGQAQTGVNQAFQTRANNQQQTQQSLSDFASEYIANRGAAKRAAAEEAGAYDQIYNPGGLEAKLAAINRDRQAASNATAQAAYAQAARADKSARMFGGNSSYLNRLHGRNLYNIGAENAGRGADQARADAIYLNEQRTGATGRRAQILDELARRNLVPAATAQQFEGANLGLLGQVADLDYGNHTYEAPETAYTRRLNFIDDLASRGLVYP
jgi:hypothetical protein